MSLIWTLLVACVGGCQSGWTSGERVMGTHGVVLRCSHGCLLGYRWEIPIVMQFSVSL